jgi:hypothetical protein
MSKPKAKKAIARTKAVAKKTTAAKVKAKVKAKATANTTVIKIEKPIVNQTGKFFKIYAENTVDGLRLDSSTKATTAALGAMLDSNGYELLPLMEARPNATFKTWYNGTNKCPENGFCNVFKTAEKTLHDKWDRTHAYINSLRKSHADLEIEATTGKQFRHVMELIKQHGMYWQGNKQGNDATARAVKKGIAKKFKDAKAKGYKKAKTGSGTSTVVAGTHNLTTVRKNIKDALTSLGIMKGNLKDTDAAKIKATQYGSLIELLENVQQIDKANK